MNHLINQEAVKHFGPQNQINKAIEEMAELIVELAKYQNQLGYPVKILEEIADVCIMAEQLKYIFGYHLIEDEIKIKQSRLANLITDTEPYL